MVFYVKKKGPRKRQMLITADNKKAAIDKYKNVIAKFLDSQHRETIVAIQITDDEVNTLKRLELIDMHI